MKKLRLSISSLLIICLVSAVLPVKGAETSASPLDVWENNIDVFNSIMENKLAMATDSPKYFLNGEKGHFDEDDFTVRPVEREKSVLVPAKAVSESFGYSMTENQEAVTFNNGTLSFTMKAGSKEVNIGSSVIKAETSPEIIGEHFYIPVETFAEIIEKSCYKDSESGLVILSDTDNPFDTSKKVGLKDEFSKAVRYERPDEADVLNDMKVLQQKRLEAGESAHPRIHITESRILKLKEQIKADEFTKKIYDNIKIQATQQKRKPLPAYSEDYGLYSTTHWNEWIENMMLVYWIEGESDFLKRSKEVILALASWPDYGKHSSLSWSRAEIALAVGYDWLYNDLSSEEKAIVKNALIKCMNHDLAIYKGESEYSGTMMTGWPTWGNNFTTQGNEGVAYAVMAVWDEEEALAMDMLRYFFRSVEYAMEFLKPDGGAYEGIGYLLAGSVQEAANAFLNIINDTGKDYGYMQLRCFRDALENLVYMDGADGIYNFGDEVWKKKIGNLYNQFWMGQHISERVYNYRKDLLENYSDGGENVSALDILYYDPDFIPATESAELGKYYRGPEYMAVRSSWDKETANFLGFKGGIGSGTHTHRDLGSFIWEANGVRFFAEHGKSQYSYANKGVQASEIYTMRAEGHNLMLFRNTNDLTTVPVADENGFIVLKEDNFENTAIGEAPDWDVSTKNSGIAEVVKENNGNRALKLAGGSSGLDAATIGISFYNEQITESFILEYEIKINRFDDENYAQFYGIYGQEGVGGLDMELTKEFKQLHALSNEKLHSMVYEKGKWYKVKSVVDLNNKTHSMYVDGEMLFEKKEIPMAIENVSLYSLQFSTRYRDMDCLLDNIKISVKDNEQNKKSILAAKKMAADQSTAAFSEITSFVNSPGNAYAIADLSTVYPSYTNNYKRGAGLFQNREILVIRDEAVVTKDCDTYWFGHTLADIALSGDKKSAILTDSESGKRAWVGIMSDGDEEFSLMNAEAFPESPQHDEDNCFSGKQKLTIKSSHKAGDKIALTVMMAPLSESETAPQSLPEVKPLSEWASDNTPLFTGGIEVGNSVGAYHCNLTMTASTDCRALPILAAYNKATRELLGVYISPTQETLQKNLPKEFSLSLTLSNENLKQGDKILLKAFVWEGLETCKPYPLKMEKEVEIE